MNRVLAFVWRQMAADNAIEEQRKELRRSDVVEDAKPPTEGGEQSDDEVDPNDPNPPKALVAQQKTYARDPYDSISDDDSDY